MHCATCTSPTCPGSDVVAVRRPLPNGEYAIDSRALLTDAQLHAVQSSPDHAWAEERDDEGYRGVRVTEQVYDADGDPTVWVDWDGRGTE